MPGGEELFAGRRNFPQAGCRPADRPGPARESGGKRIAGRAFCKQSLVYQKIEGTTRGIL